MAKAPLEELTAGAPETSAFSSGARSAALKLSKLLQGRGLGSATGKEDSQK